MSRSPAPEPSLGQGSRRWLLGLGLICVIASIWTLSGPVADALDDHWPTRKLVAQHEGSSLALEVEVAQHSRDDPRVHEALAVLPAAWVRLIREFGGRIVITQEEQLTALRPGANELIITAGLYVPSQRTAYIAYDADVPGRTALHEIGHMLDHALGQLSTQPDFLDVYAVAERDPSLGLAWQGKPHEFFARFFASYYFSDRRQQELQRRFPVAYTYFSELESHVMGCDKLSCFR